MGPGPRTTKVIIYILYTYIYHIYIIYIYHIYIYHIYISTTGTALKVTMEPQNDKSSKGIYVSGVSGMSKTPHLRCCSYFVGGYLWRIMCSPFSIALDVRLLIYIYISHSYPLYPIISPSDGQFHNFIPCFVKDKSPVADRSIFLPRTLGCVAMRNQWCRSSLFHKRYEWWIYRTSYPAW